MKNLEMLSVAARGLGSLRDEVVFVGGATIELYLAGKSVLKVRATKDVDCVVEIASTKEFHNLESRLNALGFRRQMGGDTSICRWQYEGILVDVMPSEVGVLGFTNRWYPEGFEHSIPVRLPDGQEIRIFSLPYLIATKIEAFNGRGHKDFMGSTDMEDIVTVIDGAADLLGQIEKAPAILQSYLHAHFKQFMADGRFLDGLEGHLPPAAGAGRVTRARSLLETIIGRFAPKGEVLERYMNLGGNSGISRYGIEAESITVEFFNRTAYIYTYESAGASNVEQMKRLAKGGRGLNAFITAYVKRRFARKLR